MEKIEIRKYTAADKAELISLYKKALNPDYNEAWFDWLYNNNFNNNILILVAIYQQSIVGAISEIRKTISRNGTSFICGRHLDPVVDPSMRGKRVFSILLQKNHEITSDDVDFYYCFPNEKSLPGFLKNGYRQAGPFFTPAHQARFLNVPFKEKARFLLTGLKTLTRSCGLVEKISFEELQLLKCIAPKDKYSLNRSCAYLNWRYALCPIRKYELLGLKVNGGILAACVIRQYDESRIAIIDYIAFAPEPPFHEFLLFIKENYDISKISIWDPGIKSISRYFYGKNHHNFLVRNGKTAMPEPFFDKNNWFLTAGEVESN